LAEARRFLGESYLRVKKGSLAVRELEEAARLDPAGQAEAHLSLAALYDAAGYKDRAAAEYEQFLAKMPDHPDRKKLEKYIQDNKKIRPATIRNIPQTIQF
jgi:Tfp pilus assembly protein PilF